MDSYIPETPNLAKDWCPMCEPDRDPLTEILQIRACAIHPVYEWGTADAMVKPAEDHNWSTPGEAGGEHNRKFNDLLRGEGWSNR